MSAARLAAVPAAVDVTVWEDERERFARSSRAAGRAETTITVYDYSVLTLQRWAVDVDPDGTRTGPPVTDPCEISTDDLTRFFEWRLTRTTRTGNPASAAAVAKDFRQLRVFYKWLTAAAEIANPMEGMRQPKVAEQPVPVFTDNELRALLDACKGRGFTERRDTAIFRLLLDVGLRRTEIMLEDLDTRHQLVTVTGKGNRDRTVPYGTKTAAALDVYLRARSRHKDKRLPNLWLASEDRRGTLGSNGVAQMIERRATVAGVTGAHAHRFRHTAAHAWFSAGGSEGQAMLLFGWTSRDMCDRYGKSAATERAVEAARRLSPGDRI
jgi:site-specific recombinase XerD